MTHKTKLIIILATIVLILIVIFFIIKIIMSKDIVKKIKNRKKPKLVFKRKFDKFNPFTSNPKTRARIRRIKKRSLHKKKERVREDFFLEFETEAISDFAKIRKIAYLYEKKKHLLQINASKEEQQAFRNLEELIEKMKAWEIKKKKIVVKDVDKVMKELRKVAKLR